MPKSRRKPVKYYSAARRKVYAQGDDIDALTLFEMFEWMCCICNKAIDPRKRCPDWRAATIEHVVPISKGGAHVWSNVRPAHYRCNLEKGNLTCEELNS